MDLERPSKRTRQACEQCRRKKSKCSGERPVCSLCSRLCQQCYYYGEPLMIPHQYPQGLQTHSISVALSTSPQELEQVRKWDDRIGSLESTMSQVLDTLQAVHADSAVTPVHRAPALLQSEHNSDAISAQPTAASLPTSIGSSPTAARGTHLTWEEIVVVAEKYLEFCSCQPLLLFPLEGFMESLSTRSDETLLAIIATALRYTKDAGARGSHSHQANSYRDMALSLAMTHISNGTVGLSTLQTLCLVIFYDFQDGNMSKALSLTALASMLTQNLDSIGTNSAIEGPEAEELKCCYWSVVLLRRLLGIVSPPPAVVVPRTPAYPSSCSSPAGSTLRVQFRQAYEMADKDDGIMVFIYEMAEEWVKVMAYVRDCLSMVADVSPWLTSSRYSAAMSGVMNIETRLPLLHRIKHLNFRDLTADDLNGCRKYWAPWLLSRFLYHTMICLLNHPLLITLQLQGEKNDSELFRQQASFYVTHHVRWMLYFIAFIEARSFRISDPILGYCASVVATIESQLSFSVDETTALKKQRNIESCRRLIRSMIGNCPSMEQTDRKLQDLGELMSTTYTSNINRSGSMAVDLSRLTDILSICPISHSGDSVRNGIIDLGAQASSHRSEENPQWTRLSRMPSVDVPEEDVSAAVNERTNITRSLEPNESHPATGGVLGLQSDLFARAHQVPANTSEFPADLFFNGISQDVSTWWSAFDSFDPDCPDF